MWDNIDIDVHIFQRSANIKQAKSSTYLTSLFYL